MSPPNYSNVSCRSSSSAISLPFSSSLLPLSLNTFYFLNLCSTLSPFCYLPSLSLPLLFCAPLACLHFTSPSLSPVFFPLPFHLSHYCSTFTWIFNYIFPSLVRYVAVYFRHFSPSPVCMIKKNSEGHPFMHLRLYSLPQCLAPSSLTRALCLDFVTKLLEEGRDSDILYVLVSFSCLS